MKKNKYFQFLLQKFKDECGQRQYRISIAYDEIEVVQGEKYYIYNRDSSIFLGPYGRELLKSCATKISEKDLIVCMKEKFPACEENFLFIQIYFNLAQWITSGFLVGIGEDKEMIKN